MQVISDVQTAQGITPGSNWHFEVNSPEFHAKGSNFIPPYTFYPCDTATKMLHLFIS